MHLILRFANGRRADALLLAANEDSMRLVVHRRADTVEYRRAASHWDGDDGTRVSIEAVLPIGGGIGAAAPCLSAGS
jgi:hypothetical protein